MPTRKLIAVALLGGLAIVWSAPPASSYSGGDASPTDGSGGEISATAGTPAASTVSSAGGVACSYELLNNPGGPLGGVQAPSPQPAPNAEEYVRQCGNAIDIVWVVPPTAANAVPAAIANVERLLPKPQPQMVPPNNDPHGWAYVQTPLWWWVPPSQWKPVSATASVTSGPFTASATVTASPTTIVFDPGDGSLGSGSVSCPGPGVPFDNSKPLADQSTPCSYTYSNASSMNSSGTWSATFTTVWHIAWAGSDGTGGTLASLSTTTDVAIPVAEVQSLGSDSNSQGGQ